MKLAAGPGFQIQGKTIETTRDRLERKTKHQADGVELTHVAEEREGRSGQRDTLVLQSAPNRRSRRSKAPDTLYTKYTEKNKRAQILVSSQKDFATHVALSLTSSAGGSLGKKLNTSKGAISSIKVVSEGGWTKSVEIERVEGEIDLATVGGRGTAYQMKSSFYEENGTLKFQSDRAQEWVEMPKVSKSV